MNTLTSRRTRGFSLIEMLIALTITGTLLAATLSALHASFRAYKFTTDSASNHIVSRIVMHRVLTMVRTGDEFGPFPADVYDSAQNPVTSDYVEFVSFVDDVTATRKITRIEKRDALTRGLPDVEPDRVILFGEKEGRIARANRGKDPLFFFAALQRQLGYPVVPRPQPAAPSAESPALLARRLERLEMRVKLLEEEAQGGIDLSRFDPKNVERFSPPPEE